MMKRQLAGRSVGAIGLGCMSFAGAYGATDERESFATLDRARELGVNHLDTANIYGNGVSETVLGRYLKGDAGDFVVASKAGIVPEPERHFNNEAGYLRGCLEDSLRRLRLERIDLYYIHRREAERPIEEVMETLARFVEEGKIGGIGLSEVSPATLERAHAIHPVAAVQSEYSLWTRLPELGMLQACKRLGTTFVAFSPLGRGALTSRAPTPDDLADRDFRKRNPRFMEPNHSVNRRAIDAFCAYAVETGRTPQALALAWVLSHGEHVMAIPGTRSAAHLEEDAQAGSLLLDEADIARIEALLPAGFAHGDRYSEAQTAGVEFYC